MSTLVKVEWENAEWDMKNGKAKDETLFYVKLWIFEFSDQNLIFDYLEKLLRTYNFFGHRPLFMILTKKQQDQLLVYYTWVGKQEYT